MSLPVRCLLCAALLVAALPAPAPGRTPAAKAPAASADEPARAPRDWRDPARWRRLRIGMSRLDVLRLLGEPGKVTTYYAFERWEYPDALGHRVNFDADGRLSAWGPLAR